MTAPRVSSGTEFARRDGATVTVVGRYRAVPRPVKGIPPSNRPTDHAVVVLDDDTTVFLEALDSPASARSTDEQRRFDGKRVQVTGVARRRMPARGASPIVPCLTDVTDIRETEEGDS